MARTRWVRIVAVVVLAMFAVPVASRGVEAVQSGATVWVANKTGSYMAAIFQIQSLPVPWSWDPSTVAPRGPWPGSVIEPGQRIFWVNMLAATYFVWYMCGKDRQSCAKVTQNSYQRLYPAAELLCDEVAWMIVGSGELRNDNEFAQMKWGNPDGHFPPGVSRSKGSDPCRK